jgi:hypothetical protein
MGSTLAQPLPEPGLMLYGTVTWQGGAQPARWVQGTLQWTFTSAAASGSSVVLTVPLTNLVDQFSYVLEVPFETRSVGATDLGATDGVLELRPEGVMVDRSVVTLDGQSVALVVAEQATFRFGPGDRGRWERVDLVFGSVVADADGDGLPDAWEREFFGSLDRDGSGDFDGDGLNDREEFLAGTIPRDAGSVFRLLAPDPESEGGLGLSWSSTVGRVYRVERSADVRGPFSEVARDLEATPPLNRYQDPTAPGGGTWFYRVLVER